MQNLLKKRIITRRWLIDIHRLGLHRYSVFLALKGRNSRKQNEIISILKNLPNVSYIGEFSSDWSFCFTVIGRNGSEVLQVLSAVRDKIENFASNSNYGEILRVTDFNHNSDGEEGFEVRMRSTGAGDAPIVEIDRLDHRILAYLSFDEVPQRSVIAGELGIPVSTLQYRLERLESQGVLTGSAYKIDYYRLGYQRFLVLLSVSYQTEELALEVVDFARSQLEVDYVVHRLGAWDFELGVNVQEAKRVSELSERLRSYFIGAIASVKVLAAQAFPKVAHYPIPLDGYDAFWKLHSDQVESSLGSSSSMNS